MPGVAITFRIVSRFGRSWALKCQPHSLRQPLNFHNADAFVVSSHLPFPCFRILFIGMAFARLTPTGLHKALDILFCAGRRHLYFHGLFPGIPSARALVNGASSEALSAVALRPIHGGPILARRRLKISSAERVTSHAAGVAFGPVPLVTPACGGRALSIQQPCSLRTPAPHLLPTEPPIFCSITFLEFCWSRCSLALEG